MHCIALHCIALHCIALHCITLHYIPTTYLFPYLLTHLLTYFLTFLLTYFLTFLLTCLLTYLLNLHWILGYCNRCMIACCNSVDFGFPAICSYLYCQFHVLDSLDLEAPSVTAPAAPQAVGVESQVPDISEILVASEERRTHRTHRRIVEHI